MNKVITKIRSANWENACIGVGLVAGVLFGLCTLYLSFLQISQVFAVSAPAAWMIIGGAILGGIWGACKLDHPSGKSSDVIGDVWLGQLLLLLPQDKKSSALIGDVWLGATIFATLAGAIAGLLLSFNYSSSLAEYAVSCMLLIPLIAIKGLLFMALPFSGLAGGVVIWIILLCLYYEFFDKL